MEDYSKKEGAWSSEMTTPTRTSSKVEPQASRAAPFPFPLLFFFFFFFSSQPSTTSNCRVMGRTSTRLPGFCLNRSATPVGVRSPPRDSKPVSATVEACQPLEPSANVEESNGGTKKDVELGRRIMVVVDSSPEAKTALQWTLSHSVQSNDTIVLLEIVKPSKHGDQHQRERDPKDSELLCAMKSICRAKRPEVQVEFSLVEGKERGPAIVEEARKQGVSLLVMGQKKRSVTWRLLLMWAGSKIGSSTVDYCVQNASCMALAVRRKSRRGGGYLITTKRHKDFWLLA